MTNPVNFAMTYDQLAADRDRLQKIVDEAQGQEPAYWMCDGYFVNNEKMKARLADCMDVSIPLYALPPIPAKQEITGSDIERFLDGLNFSHEFAKRLLEKASEVLQSHPEPKQEECLQKFVSEQTGLSPEAEKVISDNAFSMYLREPKQDSNCDHDWEDVGDHFECTYGCGASKPKQSVEISGGGDSEHIDLGQLSWEQIQQAATESNWIPKEYFANDWVSDVCRFLRDGLPSPNKADVPTWQPISELPRDNPDLVVMTLADFHDEPKSIDITTVSDLLKVQYYTMWRYPYDLPPTDIWCECEHCKKVKAAWVTSASLPPLKDE